MFYCECKPNPHLEPWISTIWYVRTSDPGTQVQRVLPTAHAELILNLAHDTCTGVGPGSERFAQSPALLAGVGQSCKLIDTRDLEEMMGVSFKPGALHRFFHEPADRLSGETALEDLWGRDVRQLRERLRDVPALPMRFALLQSFLTARMGRRETHPAVQFSVASILSGPGAAQVESLASQTGLSCRRLGDLFREAVGLSPKAFARVCRFQQAVRACLPLPTGRARVALRRWRCVV